MPRKMHMIDKLSPFKSKANKTPISKLMADKKKV
jgi:hypothetical protein